MSSKSVLQPIASKFYPQQKSHKRNIRNQRSQSTSELNNSKQKKRPVSHLASLPVIYYKVIQFNPFRLIFWKKELWIYS